MSLLIRPNIAWSAITVLALLSISIAAAEAVKFTNDFNIAGDWTAYQWNKAQGKIETSADMPAELKGKDKTGSLCIKISWPGGEGMRFFSVVQSKPSTLAAKISKASIWVKGSGNSRYIELHFLANGQEKDANGKPYKVGLGQLNFNDWKKLEVSIPADWPQPLTIKSLTFHDWNLPQPAEDTIYVTRLELKGE